MNKVKYAGVITRFLRNEERLISSDEKKLPFVIQAKENNSLEFLMCFLKSHSTAILADINKYGAVLLRGFKVVTPVDFEKTILSIRGMVGISQAFMSEVGRVPVDGLRFVMHTNSIIKTGGQFNLGGFHNENYHTPDVPAYISFFCENPSKQGGETGLINMVKVYDGLNTTTQEKLEKNTFLVQKWPLSLIAERYKINPETIKKAAEDFGLSATDDEYIMMNKPSVMFDPISKKKSLFTHLCAELPRLNPALLGIFKMNYNGAKWMRHKLAWSLSSFHKKYELMMFFCIFFKHPKTVIQLYRRIKKSSAKNKENDSASRISSAFTQEDVSDLAKLMRCHYSSCLWEMGDVLLIDNVQIAHAGMPGKSKKGSPRIIRAMICNPLSMSYSDHASGIQIRKVSTSKTLGEELYFYNNK